MGCCQFVYHMGVNYGTITLIYTEFLHTRARLDYHSQMSRSAIGVCPNGFTATVLQPGRYKLVRNGQTLVGKPLKTLQKSRFSGHNRTG